MSETTRVEATYRVTAPMIQVGSDYRAPKNAAVERQFRRGDVLPSWVSATEIARLVELRLIEAD